MDFLVDDFPSPVAQYTGLRVEFNSVPEPSTLVLLSMGAIGLLGFAWRKMRTLGTQQASSISACRKTAIAGMILIIVSVGSGRAAAAMLYATSISGDQIDRVDTVANTVTLYLNTPSSTDSIIFDSSQRVIYTEDTARRGTPIRSEHSQRHGNCHRLGHPCRHGARTRRQHHAGQ